MLLQSWHLYSYIGITDSFKNVCFEKDNEKIIMG